MPFFDFKCLKCEEEILLMIPWAEDMAEKLEPCKCGATDWKRLYKLIGSKTKEWSKEEREVNQLMNK
jgi:Zn ribbon nucleic-acid-binding protein